MAEGFIISPNNLTALRALPDNQVMMASGLLGLLRSIANTLGPALAAVLWDERFSRHLRAYLEDNPGDTFGLVMAMREVQNLLRWTGETVAQIPTMALTLVRQQLLAEASTAAWQDYFIFNSLMALLAILPALLVEKRLWQRWWRPPARRAQSPTSRAAATHESPHAQSRVPQ